MNLRACIDELCKLGAVSDDEARSSIERLEALEKSRPTTGQVARYAAIGATATPVIGAIGNLVAGKPLFEGGNLKEKVRGLAAQAVKGGLGASAIPIARTALDQHVEMNRLRQYVNEQRQQQARQGSPYGA